MRAEDTSAVIASLERTPGIVVPLVREVPAHLLKRRPRRDKWSAHEHACHLSLVDRLYLGRLEQFLSDARPVITPYDPGRDEAKDRFLQMDLDASMDNYVTDRRVLVDRLKGLAPETWSRTATHAEYSHYSVFIMFRHVALHDLFHAYRIEELLLKKDWS